MDPPRDLLQGLGFVRPPPANSDHKLAGESYSCPIISRVSGHLVFLLLSHPSAELFCVVLLMCFFLVVLLCWYSLCAVVFFVAHVVFFVWSLYLLFLLCVFVCLFVLFVIVLFCRCCSLWGLRSLDRS